MKAFTSFFIPKVEELPDDLTVYPINTSFDVPGSRLCHSESSGSWYLLVSLSEPVPDYPDVFDYVLNSGSFVDVAGSLHLNYLDAPFMWGKILPAKHSGVRYMPIWETVCSGEYDEEGFEKTKEVYSLIRMISQDNDITRSSVAQYNTSTCFSCTQYESLVELIKDIELRTGITF